MELTEAEKIVTEDDRIRFLANRYEAINYTGLPKRQKARVERFKFNFYQKYGIKLGCPRSQTNPAPIQGHERRVIE